MTTVEFDVIVAGLVGFMIGAALVAIISYGNRAKKTEEEVAAEPEDNKLQEEYDQYREQVNAHFAKTADAIDNLTKSYQQVFAHLSDGAQNLMDKKALQEQLEKRQGKAVTLAYLVEQEAEEDTDNKTGKTSDTAHTATKTAPVETLNPQPPASAIKSRTPTPEQQQVKPDNASENSGKPTHTPSVAATAKGAENTKTQPASNVNTTDTSKNKTPVDGGQSAAVTAKNPPTATKIAPTSGSQSDNHQRKDSIKIAVKITDTANRTEATSQSHRSNGSQMTVQPSSPPAKTIVAQKEHETAIESVKKHIKDNKKDTQA